MKTFTLIRRLVKLSGLFLILTLGSSQIANAQYCSVTSDCTWGDNIKDFSTTGGITNITNNSSGCSTNGYEDFTSTHRIEIAQGSSFNFSVQADGAYSEYFTIWIDWNNDGDFTDTGEEVWNSGSAGTNVFTGTVNVPSDATAGSTVMRVMCDYDAIPDDPCNTGTYGETEDYAVTVFPVYLPFTESFEASTMLSYWTTSASSGGPWEIGNESSNSPGYNNDVADHTGNGGYYTWMDFSGTDVGVILESPEFDVSSNSNIILEFYEFSYYSSTSSYANYLYIETFNGATWDGVDTIQQNGSSWVQYSIDLTSNTYNGGNNLKFRFRAESHGTSNDYYNDILIDDINLYEPKPNDAGITDIFVLNATGNQTVKAVLENFGTATLTSATINWDVDGTPQTAYSYSGSLAPGSSDTITLGAYNFIAGSQTITVTSSNPNASADGDPSNDSYSLTQTYVTPINLAYYDDFETFSSDWNVVDGSPGLHSARVQSGSYALDILDGASSGTIELICNPAPNPELSFNYLIDYYNYNDFEVEILEASSNSWQNIHTFTGYNDDTWINEVIDLASYDTETGVFKLRFSASKTYSSYEVLLDNLSLVPVYAVDAGISQMSTIDVSGTSPIRAEIKNYGTDTLLNADIYYSVMGGTHVGPYAWTGVLAKGETEADILLGTYNFTVNDTLVEIWTNNPNGQADQYTVNDTLPATVNIVTDAGALAVDNGSIQYGNSPVNVFISNLGTDTIKSATIGWSINGAVQSSYAWTGSLAAGDGAGPFYLGNYNFDAGNYTLKVWTESPNSRTDDDATNDTIEENYYFYLDVGISHVEQIITPGVNPINVKIQNYGNIPLISASIEYSYNGTAGPSYSWTGNLDPGNETGLINIGNGTFNYGSNTIQVETVLPNGELGDDNPVNDKNTITFDILADIGVVEGWLPQDNCGRGNDTLKLAVKNFGTEVMDDNFSITYINLNSGATVTENISGTSILPGDTLWHTFSTPVNLAVSDKDSTFNLKGYTTYSLDGTHSNDTIAGQVESWYMPNAPIASGTSVSYGNSANLTAALNVNGDSLKWYDNAMNFLDYGTTYTTQPLYDTTTFYVRSETSVSGSINSDITSGSGSSTTYYVPFYISTTGSSFKYSKFAGLYNASDLIANGASAGTINDLAFYKTDACGYTNSDATCNIYIKQVNDAYVTSSDWATLISGATNCYSSANQNINTYSGWQEFNFSTPFNWDGSSNILIMVEWYRPNAHTCNYPNWQYTSVSSSRVKRYAGSSSSNTLSSSESYLPNIKFNLDASFFTPHCESTPIPVTVDVTNIPSDAGIVDIEEVTETGTQDISVTLSNFTSVALDSVQIDYQVNGTPGITYKWYGSLGKNDSAMVTIGSGNLVYGMNTIKAWTNLPNGATDPDGTNDTTLISFNIYSDIEVVEVTSPETYCDMGNESVMVKFANVGIDTITAFDANYLVAGTASSVTESVTTTLAPNDTMTYTFSTLVDLTVAKDSIFLIDVFADNLSSDNNQLNDTIHYNVLSPITPAAPVAVNDTVDYGNSANLKALSDHYVFWYDAAIGGNKIGGPDTMFTSPLLYDTTTVYAEARSGIANVKITEIVQYMGGSGATLNYPSYLLGDFDGLEITNQGDAPENLSNWTVNFYSTNATWGANGSYTFPSGTVIMPAEIFIIDIKSPVVDSDPANNYFCAGISGNPQSSAEQGYYIKDEVGNIIDAVATNGQAFSAATGVTTSDWSGSIPSSSGKAGVSRLISDNNNASDWGVADTDFPNQTFGTLNPGLTAGGFSCTSSRIPVTAIVKNFPAKDAGVVKVNQPVDGPGKNNAEQLNITVKNYGTVSIDTIPVAFEFDGNAAVVDTVFAALNPGDTANFTFASTLDMHLTGTYDLIIYTSLDGDNTTNNDTVVESIIHSDYCISRADFTDDTDIGNVTITHPFTGNKVLNNGVALPVLNSPLATKLYTDYSGIAPTDLQQGQSYAMDVSQITSGAMFFSASVAVYIDFNQDGILDATEEAFRSTTTDAAQNMASGDLVIPATAKTGTTRMRVVMDESYNCPPCGVYSYGETEDYTVNILPQVWADAGMNDTICNTHSSTLTASGNGNFEWSTMETTASITVSPATETMFYVTVTDTWDYETVDSVSVYVRDLPVLSYPVMSDVCVDAPPLMLDMATPAGGYYTGAGVMGNYFDPATAGVGTHTLKYVYADMHGCTDSVTQDIVVNPLPVIAFTPMADICVDASAFLLTSATPPGGTYSGPGVDGSGNFDPAAAGVGTHYIKYEFTDGKGCYNIDSTTITVLPLPVISASSVTNPVNYGTTANLDVSVGSSSYSYAWSPADSLGNAADATIKNPVTKQLIKPTIFTVSVTDQITSCSNISTVTVGITGGPLSATPVSFRDTVCTGDTTTLYAQASGGSEAYTYSWTSTPAGFTSSAASPLVTVNGITTYHVTVDDGFNSVTESVTVETWALPTVNTTFNDTGICYGDSALIGAYFTGEMPFDFVKTDGTTPTTVNNYMAMSMQQYVHPTDTTNYMITEVTDGNGCYNTSNLNIQVDIHPLPTVTILEDSVENCFGDSSQINISMTGQSPWMMYTNKAGSTDTSQSGISNTPILPYVYDNTVGDNYYEITKVVDAYGCTNYHQDTFLVRTWDLPTASIFEDSIAQCFQDSMQININFTGPAPWNVHITDGTDTMSEAVSNSLWQPWVEEEAPGFDTYYIIEVEDAHGCKNYDQDTITIETWALPQPDFTGLDAEYCNSPMYDTLTGIPAGGYFTGMGVSGDVFNPGVVIGGNTYDITYIYTDANGCTNDTTKSTLVRSLPTVSFTGLASDYCIDAGAATLSGSPAGGNFTGPGISGNIFDPSSAGTGTHTITYTYMDIYGCVNSTTQSVTVNPLPLLIISGINASGYCVDASAFTVTGTPSGGTFSGTGIDAAGSFNPAVAGAGTHTVTYTYTDMNGCTNDTTATVTIHPLPVITIGINPEYCYNGSYDTLSPSPAGGTFIGMGLSGNVFKPHVAGTGTHTVTYMYTDMNGCFNSKDTVVTVNPAPAVDFTGLSATYCDNDSMVVTLNGNPSGGSFTGNGINGSDFTASVAGTGIHQVTYTYTNSFGCTDSRTRSTEVLPAPAVSFSGLNTAYCSNDSADILMGSPAAGTFTGTGVMGYMFDPAMAGAGNHMVTYSYTAANGCTSTAEATTMVHAAPVVTLSGLSAEHCITDAAELLIGAPAGGTLSGNGVYGNYFHSDSVSAGYTMVTYSYMDANGCHNLDVDTCMIWDMPTPYLGPDTTVCYGDSITLDATTTATTYTWTTGDTLPVIQLMIDSSVTAGVYVTNGTCANMDTVHITMSEPDVMLGPDTTICHNLSLTLDAGAGYDAYIWSTGETSRNITIDSLSMGLGTHMITVIITDSVGCTDTDTIMVTIEDCTGIHEFTSSGRINIYPNPSEGIVNLEIQGITDNRIELCIYSFSGKKIVCEQIERNFKNGYFKTFDLSTQPKGVYLIRLTGAHIQQTKRIIIQ